MRFDEFVLRVPGEEFRIRFHEHLTVLAGVGGLERQAMLDAVVGALTGQLDASTLTGTDHTGRPVEIAVDGGVVRAVHTDDGSPAPLPVGWLADDADALRGLMVLGPDDLGPPASSDARDDDPPELAEAKASLRSLAAELSAATEARAGVVAVEARIADLDERIRRAEGDAARREYAAALAALERVRAEAAALQSGVHGAETDRLVLAGADRARACAERWRELTAAAERARAAADALDGLEPADVARLLRVPEGAPEDLGRLLAELHRASAHVAALEDRLRQVASASLPEPEDARVLALATIDQHELWAAHERVVDAGVAVAEERIALGGIGADGEHAAAIDELEAAHAASETASEVIDRRLVPVVGGSGLVAVLGLLLGTSSGPAVGLGLCATAAVLGVLGLGKPWRARTVAEKREAAALARVGVPTYLGFHLRRVDATLDPTTVGRLGIAEGELAAARRAWVAVAGDVDVEHAGTLRDQVRAYADALAAQQGAVQEVAELRRTLDELAVPDLEAARERVVATVAPYGIGASDVEGLEAELLIGFVERQVALGHAARRRRSLEEADAAADEAAAALTDALARLGFGDGALEARIGALEWAVERAREREAARAAARPLAEVEADLHHLNAEVRRLRRPEWAEVTAVEADGPDVEELEAQRAELLVELAAAREAARAVSAVDLERLADRHAAVERRVAALEVQLRGERDDGADIAELQQYLLAALTRANHVGPRGEPVPVLLDDPFARVPADRKWELMDMLRRLAEKTQVLYLTDDPFIGAWARRRADEAEISLLEPVE